MHGAQLGETVAASSAPAACFVTGSDPLVRPGSAAEFFREKLRAEVDGRPYTPPPPSTDNKMMPRNKSFAARCAAEHAAPALCNWERLACGFHSVRLGDAWAALCCRQQQSAALCRLVLTSCPGSPLFQPATQASSTVFLVAGCHFPLF